jgi:tetratricopeptide (TPR) repeat protein
MPVLEALGRLCQEPGGEQLIELFGRHAPTWLVQIPALLSTEELEALQRQVAGATRERMLREMAAALEAVTTERPVVLSLEDLHWSDASTLELLSVLARRPEQARLLVLGTYRPVEMLANGHPLRTVKQELQLHRQCVEQQLGLLNEEHVAKYLAMKFSPERGAQRTGSLQELARKVHRRTEGNPLFMVNVVEYLAAQGGLGESVEMVQSGVPGDLRHMIEEQIHRLSAEEQRLLEVASVAGIEFSATTVAAGVEAEVEVAEERCTQLARREFFLRTSGSSEWPDGTVAARYSFLHSLYQEVLYERLPAGRRQWLHQRIGERTEQGYGDRAREVAAELAMHFERGRDSRKAIRYLQQAGENALRRSAHQEAIDHFTKGLALLKTLPDTPERAQQELRLQASLNAPLWVVKGWSAPEVKQIMDRAWELCQQVDETQPIIPDVLSQLAVFHLVRGELPQAHEWSAQCLSLAQQQHDWEVVLRAHLLSGQVVLYLGEFTQARTHVEQSLFLCKQFDFRAFIHMQDPEVDCLHYAAQALWYLGYPDQALSRTHEGLTLARELAPPFGIAISLGFVAEMHSLRREWALTQAQAEEMLAITTEHAFPVYLAIGLYLRGWALAEQGQLEEGLAQMQQGITAFCATGAGLALAWRLAGMAQVYGKMGQPEEGLRVLAEALEIVTATHERHHEAEIYRLKGELLLAQEGKSQNAKVKTRKSKVTNPPIPAPNLQEEAEACFLKAIEIARQQQAKMWELRATVCLARLWQRQDKRHAARNILSEIYGWFTEGFDTKDLQEAKVIIEELAERTRYENERSA